MVLIKLLYLLDREALIRWGRPVSFDDFYSMNKGPILSNVHDLITEESAPQEDNVWNKFISSPSNFKVKLLKDIGTGELSEAEDELIDELFAKYGKRYMNRPFDLVDLLHKTLPEWKEVRKGERTPIEISEVLRAGQKSADDIKAIEDELENLGNVQVFA